LVTLVQWVFAGFIVTKSCGEPSSFSCFNRYMWALITSADDGGRHNDYLRIMLFA
jgi:hypothetical protein